MRSASINGWWYGSDDDARAEADVLACARAAAAMNTSGEAMIS